MVKQSPDGKHVVTLFESGRLQIWTAEGELVAQPWIIEESVEFVDFSPSGRYLYTYAEDSTLRLWDLESNHQALEVKQGAYGQNNILFDDSETFMITRPSYDIVQVWGIEGDKVFEADHRGSNYGISPIGQHLFTSPESKSLQLWSFDGKKQATLEHAAAIEQVSFSPDGKNLFVQTVDDTVHLWSFDGKKQATLEHAAAIEQVSFSPDGKNLFVQTENDTVHLWDLEGNSIAVLERPNGVLPPVFSQDGKYAATVSREYWTFLEDFQGTVLAAIPHDSEVTGEMLNADSSRLLTITVNGTVRLSDASSQGQTIFEIAFDETVRGAKFSQDGQYFVVRTEHTVHVWNINGEKVSRIEPELPFYDVELIPESNRILTISSYGQKTQLWKLDGTLIRSFESNEGYYYNSSAKFSPDGAHLLLYSNDRSIKLWNLALNKSTELNLPDIEIRKVGFSPDGTKVLTYSDEALQLWDLDGKLLTPIDIDRSKSYPRSATFSPDGKYIITSGEVIQKWDLDGSLKAEFEHSTNYFLYIPHGETSNTNSEISNSETHLISSRGKTVRTWDAEGTQLSVLKHDLPISSIHFNSEDKTIYVILVNGQIKAWTLQGEALGEVRQQPKSDFNVHLSQDNERLIVHSQEDSIHLWNSDGKSLKSLPTQGRVSRLNFRPDGKYLAAVFERDTSWGKGIARVWETEADGEAAVAQVEHQGRIYGIAFSPDKGLFATASSDNTARLWTLKGKEKKPSCWHPERVKSVNFTADGKRIITETEAGVLSVWDLACNRLGRLTSVYGRYRYGYSNPFHSPLSNQMDGLYQASHLFAVSRQLTARLWGFSGNELAKTQLQGVSNTSDVSLTPDGSHVVIFQDGAISLRNILDSSASQPIQLPAPGEVRNFQISDQGQYLATLTDGHPEAVTLKAVDSEGRSETQSFTIRRRNEVEKTAGVAEEVNFSVFLLGVILFLLGLPGGYLIFRWLLLRKQESPPAEDPIQAEPIAVNTAVSLTSEDISGLEADDQVAQAVRQGAKPGLEASRLTDVGVLHDYLPVNRRQMKQSWRYLRRFIRAGAPTELDIEATVREIGQQGVLLQPVLRPRRVNRTELLLLIDRDGSMAPFHDLTNLMIETAIQGGRLGKADIYYFHNCPHQYLYHDPIRQDAEPIESILYGVSEYTGVLIISDAGAARGGLNLERAAQTAALIKRLKQQMRYIAWINPMPRSRWLGTTAGEIAGIIPMFELHRQGLQDAIGVLRGKVNHNPV